jgi:hypothetical protein
MELTAAERSRILAGSTKPLRREHKPELEEGAEIVVAWTRPGKWADPETGYVFAPEPEPAMTITVVQVVRRNKGGWAIRFDVADHRDPAWFPAKDGGYTQSHRMASDDLEAPIDADTVAKITAQAKQAHEERRMQDKDKAEAEARRLVKAVSAHLRDRAIRRARLGLSPALLVADVEALIKADEREAA